MLLSVRITNRRLYSFLPSTEQLMQLMLLMVANTFVFLVFR